MDDFVDHYDILGLPSDEGGAKLTEKEISKAYKWKALELHPDKRPDDPNAHDDFQKLKSSYEILKDEKARKLFDDLLRIKREQVHKKLQHDSKKRRMMTDLEERERSAFAPDPARKARDEEERIAKKLKDEIERIRAQHANKNKDGSFAQHANKNKDGSFAESKSEEVRKKMENVSGVGLDKERVVKVSWEKIGEGYTATRLKELFQEFGEVEDVVIRSTKKKGSALVVMVSRNGVVAATGTMCGDLSNPLLVVPLQRAAQAEFPTVEISAETERLSNLVGTGHQAFEDSVLQRLKKAAEKQKSSATMK